MCPDKIFLEHKEWNSMVVEPWKLHGHIKRGQGRREHREMGMFPSQLGRAPLKKISQK